MPAVMNERVIRPAFQGNADGTVKTHPLDNFDALPAQVNLRTRSSKTRKAS
jgi:hypothetical protein